MQGTLPRIGYLTGRYPQVTHTFVQREIRALRERGVAIETLSVWRTSPDDLLSPLDIEEAEGTTSLLPPDVALFARAHLQAVLSKPRAYLRAMLSAARLGTPGVRGRALSGLWFVEAIVLAHHCARRGIKHLHVHLNGTAPAIALIANGFAGSSLTYSMTVHGSKEFYGVEAEGLEEKATGALFVVCISDYTRSQVMAFLPEDHWAKLTVVRCGVDPEDYAPVSETAPDREPEVNVLTVGRLDRMKGMPLLVEAVGRLRAGGQRVRLTIVGDGPSRRALEHDARALGIADAITWAGAVGSDRMPEYYRSADIFCLPSFAEGVPIVLMEAMASSVPVVATRITGIPELIRNEESGLLVTASRVDELADAIGRLVASPQLRESLGSGGRARVVEDYSIARSASELKEVFCRELAS